MIDADAEKLGRLAAELDLKTAALKALEQVSSDINSTLELDEIYDAALRTMGELFEFHHAIILLLEPGGNTLTVVASRGYENQAVGGRVSIGTGVIGIVAKRRKMLQVSNLGQQRTYAAAQRRQMIKSGRGDEITGAVPVPGLPNAESQLAIPLVVRDELVGVFSIESPVRRTFSEHERTLLSIVANQIASAIHNARLFDERRRTADELRAVNATLEARVAERTAALERELLVAQELVSDARSRADGPLLGDSAAVSALRDQIARQAAHLEPLLLTGPPGAGKEAVAHAVHVAARRGGAFMFVSCPELHTQSRGRAAGDTGAPDPAERSFLSRVELAAGGTLFLDAVHDLPSGLQHALVQMLEKRSSAHAAADPTAAGVRVIASTPRDLTREGPGRLLEPLVRILTVNGITVPALADRREDIPALVDYFVRRHARRIGKTVDGVSPASMDRLKTYLWPGNIRELRTVLERAVLVSRSSVLEIDQELLDERLAVGSYRLIAQLGAGGMGEVWRARHRLLARPAAVKLIRNDEQTGVAREQLVRRFQREAQVTAALRSPHTVQLFDFGVDDGGSFYYVMELLDGLDLHDIVKRFGPQPAERVVMLLRQACLSLAEAHEQDLVHRDIKPANLFVTRLGHEYDYLKVLDFGIVKAQPAGHELTLLSAQGLLPGTPAFMAPELVFSETTVDGRADLYSLACAAYWALTGQLVFDATTAAQMLVHHAQTKPVPPSHVSELPIPRSLETIIMTCLEKDPSKRFSSALELDGELAKISGANPWTNERAREWWSVNAPDALARG